MDDLALSFAPLLAFVALALLLLPRLGPDSRHARRIGACAAALLLLRYSPAATHARWRG